MDHELNLKLGNIIKDAMLRDGVRPRYVWNPNSKTVAWLRERGFNMGHKTAKGEWSMAYGTQTPRGRQTASGWRPTWIAGFVETKISVPWISGSKRTAEAWIFVPEDMVEKILALGCP